MANNGLPELSRFTLDNSSIRDENGQFLRASLKDLDRQISEVTKALASATDSSVYVSKAVTDAGKATVTFDVPKSMEANARASFDAVVAKINQKYGYDTENGGTGFEVGVPAQAMRILEFNKSFYGAKAKQELKRTIEKLGGEVTSNPTKKRKDQMLVRVPVSEQDYQEALAEAGGSESKARTRLVSSYTKDNLRRAVKYSDDIRTEGKKKEEAEEQKRAEQEKKASRLKNLMLLGAVVKGLQVIADIARRILTASLARATETKRDSLDSKSLGVSYPTLREYKAQARAMGMDENVFANALSQLQSAFGDISNLDSKAIGELAKVMSGDVLTAIQNGLGRSDPERTMKEILNAYFERGQNGINSLGMSVGKYQAERELATALEKAGLKDLADILRNMFYMNDTGVYRGRISNADSFADYMALFTAYTAGLTPADQKAVSELGQVVEQLKEKFSSLKENLEKGLLLSLEGLINRINSWDLFKSAEEKAKDTRTNINSNRQAKELYEQKAEVAKTLYSSSFAESGVDFSKLSGGKASNAEEYFKFRKTAEGQDWHIHNDEQAEEFNKLSAFLDTEEGRQALMQVQAYDVAQAKVALAESNIKQGIKKGKVIFNATDFTEASYQRAVRDKMNFYVSSANEGYTAAQLLLHYKGSFPALFEDEGARYEALKETYYGGRDITYAEALETKNAGSLTKELYETAMARYKDKYPAEYKKLRKMKQQDAVKKALADRVLAPYEVSNLVRSHVLEEGYGVAPKQQTMLDSLLQERGLAQFEDYAGAVSALTQGLQLQEARQFLKENSASGYTASVGRVDPKTQNVTITLIAKDKDSSVPRATLTFMTDSMSSNGYFIDMSTGKASAQ